VFWKGELAEDTVYILIGVELVNQRVELCLRRFFGKLVSLGVKAYLLTSASFVSDVDLRGGI
jgi:hypothetical protein